MTTIKLRHWEREALRSLEDGEQLEIEYKGLPCFIVRDRYGGQVIDGAHYYVGFYNIDEFKIKEVE